MRLLSVSSRYVFVCLYLSFLYYQLPISWSGCLPVCLTEAIRTKLLGSCCTKSSRASESEFICDSHRQNLSSDIRIGSFAAIIE